MKVVLVAGARPNFMKIAPIYREAVKHEDITCKLVHTGQHYDYEMSQTFFDDLDIPAPHYFLNVGSGSHAVQTAGVMTGFEAVCEKEKPDCVIVVGDVNSTLACAIVAKKLLISLAHVEAGLRSFDPAMPEEINRVVTDSISDFFFVTEKSAVENLMREGKPENRVHFVGHVMIDNLLHQLGRVENGYTPPPALRALKMKLGRYIFLTLHRPSNVDRRENLAEIVEALNRISKEYPIAFPVHPRTGKMLASHGIVLSPDIYPLPPLSFKESLYLWKDAVLVMTDSGGLQEETTALGVPCITLRQNTERPVTLLAGTNILGGTETQSILKAYRQGLGAVGKAHQVPPLWDGRASERIWDILRRSFPGGNAS
jgi:UDP-N-acetylglucosamine 2-epimerase (non-hydrolysing)